jgi:hypothetical protein
MSFSALILNGSRATRLGSAAVAEKLKDNMIVINNMMIIRRLILYFKNGAISLL